MRKLLWALPITLILAACSPAPATTVTSECADAITAVGNAPDGDFDAEDAAIAVSAEKCTTADEYIQAVKANPGSWLYKSAKDVDEKMLLMSACSVDAEKPMCKDAKEKGLLK